MEQRTLKEGERDGRGGGPPAGPLLLRLISADDPSAPSARHPLHRITEVCFGRAPVTSEHEEGKALQLRLADPYLSSRHAVLEREGRAWFARDLGSTNGTFVDGARLAAGERRLLGATALFEVGRTFYWFRAEAPGLAPEHRIGCRTEHDERGPSSARSDDERGEDPAEEEDAAMRRASFEAGRSGFSLRAAGQATGGNLFGALKSGAALRTLRPEWELELRRAEHLARTTANVLVEGESGAGKELLARFLHERSGRKGPLVALNCAALPEALLEDELFGHVKGAYSGAQADRDGLIRASDGGTLLLDEIGDMALAVQAKLLRVLEERRVRPLGSDADLPVDLRVVAATHQDLDELVEEGRFRADLMARLGLVRLRVPPLRERREDLGLLIRALLEDAGALGRVRFEAEALRALLRHGWPLNVRELRSALLSAALAAASGPQPATIALAHLPESVGAARPQPAPLSPEDQVLRAELERLLQAHRGNVSAVARELGKARTQVRRWLARFELG